MRLIDADRAIEELESYKEYFVGTPDEVEEHNDMVNYAISVLEDCYAWKDERSCKTCRFSRDGGSGLYRCFNTEICLESNQTEKFYCSKWEEKADV